MVKRSDFIGLAVLTVVLSYALTVGATFTGILDPAFHPLSLGMLAFIAGGWLLLHWGRNWKWHRTALDTVFLLWFLAFGLSLLANLDAWRRIAIGLWYMGLYIGVWYILHDMLANRVLTRVVIIDALLITGFVITLLGFVQLQTWLRQLTSTGVWILPPRPVSVFGNPNFLSSFLIVLIPLTLSRWMLARTKPPKFFLAIYLLLQIGLLILTNSRGAWIGIVVGLAVWLGLFASRNGRLTAAAVKEWWSRQTKTWRTMLTLGGLALALLMLGLGIYLARSLNDPSRSAGLRTEIYTAALNLFAEKPITGQGLFTFGRGLVRLPGINPDKPHSHAHQAVLHIAAELGLVGLAALAVTLYVGWRTLTLNWHASTSRERLILTGTAAAVAAFGVHQLTDIPAMMPAIAFTGLLAWVLTLAPIQPEPVEPAWSRFGHPVEMVGLCVLLLLSAVWQTGIYTRYVTILSDGGKTRDYRQAAAELQSVIGADPDLSLYPLEQGLLYGMAASQGDAGAARSGIEAYERFIQLDPGYAVAWANLAALHWQLGEREVAIDALQQAIRLDEVEWNFHALLGRYAAAVGNREASETAYAEALRLYPDASLYTELAPYANAHPEVLDRTKMTVSARVVQLLAAGQVDEAKQVWLDEPTLNSAPGYVMQALIALAEGDLDVASGTLATAERLAVSPVEQAWVHVGKARLAQSLGDTALAEAEVEAAETALMKQPLEADDETLINIAYAQFLQLALERQYVPQVDYRTDPVLLYLLERTIQ